MVCAAQVAAAEEDVEFGVGAGIFWSVRVGQWRHRGWRPWQPHTRATRHAAALPAALHCGCTRACTFWHVQVGIPHLSWHLGYERL